MPVALQAALVVVTCLLLLSLWFSKSSSNTQLISVEQDRATRSVGGECCARVHQLTSALFRAEQALRQKRWRQRTLLLAAGTSGNEAGSASSVGAGVRAAAGARTRGWGGRAALWGVVPLWRTGPPPHTLLAAHAPRPADCWPFSGSQGEVHIELASRLRVRWLSVEHVRPDTARSAPRHIALYGILENGTWVKALRAEYTYSGPARQLYSVQLPTSVTRVALRVLSNHGNPRYTCIYRVQVHATTTGAWGSKHPET